jgi:hypothetical protein
MNTTLSDLSAIARKQQQLQSISLFNPFVLRLFKHFTNGSSTNANPQSLQFHAVRTALILFSFVLHSR